MQQFTEADYTVSMCFILFDSSLCTEFVKSRLVKEYLGKTESWFRFADK